MRSSRKPRGILRAPGRMPASISSFSRTSTRIGFREEISRARSAGVISGTLLRAVWSNWFLETGSAMSSVLGPLWITQVRSGFERPLRRQGCFERPTLRRNDLKSRACVRPHVLDAPPFGLRPSQAKPAPPWMLRPSGYARRMQSLLLLGCSALRAAPVAGKARSSFSRARSRVTFTPGPDRGWDGAGGTYRCRASTGARDEAVRTFGVAGAVADPLRDHHFRPSSRPRPNRRSDRIRHLQAVLS